MKALRDMTTEEALRILEEGRKKRLHQIPAWRLQAADKGDLWKFEHQLLTGSVESFKYSNSGGLIPASQLKDWKDRLF